MAKYEYSALKTQLQMLAAQNGGKTSIEKLRVFYPKAGWTELRGALQTLAENDTAVKYDPKTHGIEVQ